MTQDRAMPGAVRIKATLCKWEGERTPADGEPDEVVERVYWQRANGHVITDPATIARLEAAYEARERERSN